MSEIEINYSLTDSLLESIKKDNLKTFENIVGDGNLLSLCYGRFPILSILYLYESNRILSKYENKLNQSTSYIFVDEDIEVYNLFKVKAKRSLRFFGDNIVSPNEMLAILGDGKRLNKFINDYDESSISFLSKIFSLSNNKYVKNKAGKFVFPTKDLSMAMKLMTSSFAFIMVIMIILSSLLFVYLDGVPNGTKDKPYSISTSSIIYENLESNSYLSLKNDVSLSSSIDTFNLHLDGNGKTIFINDQTGPLIKTLNGSISNVNIVINNSNILVNSSSSLFALVNQGKIENVNVIVKNSKFIVEENNELESETTYLGILSSINTGSISNCSVTIENLECTGYTHVNAYIAGIAGKNTNEIVDCKTFGTLSTDTMDVAGICAENGGIISKCVNNLKITQTTFAISWNPNAAGIAGLNEGRIINSINYGDVSAISNTTFSNKDDDPDLSILVGGISAQNTGSIQYSLNKGNVSALAEQSNVLIGGIVAYSTGQVSYCGSEGEVASNVNDEKMAFIGGLIGRTDEYGTCSYSFSLSTFNLTGTSTQLFKAGICGVCSYFQTMAYYIVNNAYYLDSKITNGVFYVVSGGIVDGDFPNVVGFTDIEKLKQSGVYYDETSIV